MLQHIIPHGELVVLFGSILFLLAALRFAWWVWRGQARQ